MSENVLVFDSDDTIYVRDDYGIIHSYQVTEDGELVELKVAK